MSLLHQFLTTPTYVALFLVALTSSSLPACSDGIGLTPEEHITRAKDFQDKGDLKAAVIELKNALQQAPGTVEARWLLGKIYVETGDGPAAEKEIRRAIELGLTLEAAAIPLTRALLLRGEFQQIVASPLKPENLQESDQAELWALRGNAYLGMGKVDLADESYNTATSISADSPDAGFGKALVAFSRNKPDVAREYLAKALQTSPEFGPAWGLLGDIEVREGNFEKAEEMYDRAIELNKYVTRDRVKRAEVRLGQGNLEGAREDISVLKGANVALPSMYYIEGRIHFQEQRYSDAQTAFEQALKLAPTSTSVKVYLAASHLAQGHTQQALALADQLNAVQPDSSTVKHLFASALFRASEFTQAKVVLDQALENSQTDVYALNLMGNIALLEGRPKDGVEYFSKAVELSPDSADLKQRLTIAKVMAGEDPERGSSPGHEYRDDFLFALAKFKQGDFRQAYEIAKSLHESNPDEVDPVNLMAASHLALGESAQARATLGKALQMAPYDSSATMSLAKLDIQEGRLDGAKTGLTAYLDEIPGNAQAAILLVNVEAQLGNSDNAIQVLAQAVEHNPDNTSLRVMLAREYYNAGRLGDVLALTRDTDTEQYNEQPILLEFRGKAHMLAGDIPSANRDFKRWTDIEPGSARAHFIYSDSLARGGQLARAQAALERAIQIDPNYLPTRIGEIKMLVYKGEIQGAKAALTKVKQDFGDQPEVSGIEGWFALGTRDYPTAEKSLSQALEQKPDTELTVLLTRALWAQRKHKKALQVMQDWLENHPQDFTILLELADGYLVLEREEEARAIYARAIKLYPNHVPTLNNLAWLFRGQDLKQAVTYAERAYELAPGESKVADTLGTLLLKQGKNLRGYTMVRKAAELSPEDPEIQLHFGRTLVEQKKFAEAKKVLGAVVANNSDSDFSHEADALLQSIPQ